MWPLFILGRILNVSWGWLSGCCAHFLKTSWDVSSVSWNVSWVRSVLECVLGLCPCVSEIVLRMCSQGVLECVLGMCPQSVLAVSWSVSSSWPWHVPTGRHMMCPRGAREFGYSGVCSQLEVSSGCLGVSSWCPGVYLSLVIQRGGAPRRHL